MSLPDTLAHGPTPHKAVDLFGPDLGSSDDGRALDALRSITQALDRQQLDIGRVLHRGLEALSSPVPAPDRFDDHRDAAKALIAKGGDFSRPAAQFLGGLTVQQDPMTEKQAEWLGNLLRRSSLPAYVPREA